MAQLHAVAFAQTRAWSAAEFETLLTQTGVHALGDTRAFALIRVIAGESELLTIATAPEHQRQGLGRMLLARCEVKAAERGAEEMFLEVADDNTAAITLYKSAGFAEAGRRSGYYKTADGHRTDALLFRKIIPQTA